jgi:hypothetical protein
LDYPAGGRSGPAHLRYSAASMLAQALLEHGALDALVTGISMMTSDISLAFRQQPWLWGVLAVGVFFLARRRPR